LTDRGTNKYPESRAICRYISTKYAGQGTSLIPPPTDLKATALFEQAASVEQANFDAFASKLVAEKVFKPYVSPTTAGRLGLTEVRTITDGAVWPPTKR
jgi:glutathione S-transferase